MPLLQRNCRYALIFYKVNSLTDNFISCHGGDIEPAVQTFSGGLGIKMGNKKHEEKGQDNKMLRQMCKTHR